MEDDPVYQWLVTRAKGARFDTYKDVAEATDVTGGGVAYRGLIERLKAINEFEHGRGRPLLGSIVIAKKERRPEKGFYKHAQELGYEFADKERFWRLHVIRVFLYWCRNYEVLDRRLNEMELE